MIDLADQHWLFWALGVAAGLPIGIVALTELRKALARRGSGLTRPVELLRNYLLPLAALLILMVGANQIPAQTTSVRVVATALGFVVLVLVLSGLNATLFQGAPAGSWRRRMPAIFLDVARFIVIAVGVGLIFAFIWGANIGGLFTALGIGSIVLGLILQNSIGQIISGLLVLFEQPFQVGDWIATRWLDGGRVIEVNWRATHLDSGSGVYVLPNSVLATEWFINYSLPRDDHSIDVVTEFSATDPPDAVCAMLAAVADGLPYLRPDAHAEVMKTDATKYTTTIPLSSPADDEIAESTFLRWVWYAARRAGVHLDDARDDFPDAELAEEALRVIGETLRIGRTDLHLLVGHVRVTRYGSGETLQQAGSVPTAMVFLLKGAVRLTAVTDTGARVGVRSLERGDFLGQTTLVREPVLAGAQALDEVTVAEVDREHIEKLVMRRPLLMAELGRTIEDRRRKVQRIVSASEG